MAGISVPKIVAKGQFWFNLSSKMWSHVLEYSVILKFNSIKYLRHATLIVCDLYTMTSLETGLSRSIIHFIYNLVLFL